MKTIYYNGKVYTGELPLAEAFAVEDGRFIAVGTREEVERAVAEADGKNMTDIIFKDLEGQFVCYGFCDSHMHLMQYGQMLNCAALAGHTDSLADLKQAMKDFIAEKKPAPGQWVNGYGWNQDYFNDADRMPDRYDLDEISTEIPIYITRCCYHAMVVNSKALEMCGITADTVAPAGGKIGMYERTDALGNTVCEPDGRLYEDALDLVYNAIPPFDKETLKKFIEEAANAVNVHGVTYVMSDDYSIFRQIPWEVVEAAFRELEEEGRLNVRVYEQCNFRNVGELEAFLATGRNTGTGTDFFRTGPLKLILDGSLGARTAYLSKPYADDSSTRGMLLIPEEEVKDLVLCAHRNGMQIAAHAIGDGAVDLLLESLANATEQFPREDHRHGIVHCQITREDQLRKMAELKMHIYAQTIFLDYDIKIVHSRVEETAETSYSWKTLMDAGLTVSNGSDCPVEIPVPMAGMQCAVTRRSLPAGEASESGETYLPEQAFTVREAVDSYTGCCARASFTEDYMGRIASGYLADFVVLDQNPFEQTGQVRLDLIRPLATYVGGKCVYSR